MNKKTLLLFFTLIFFALFVFVGILRYRSQKTPFFGSIPLLPTATPRSSLSKTEDSSAPNTPQQTNIITATKQVSDEVSLAEKDKVFDSLPLRKENFNTSVNLPTTINLYSFSYDPPSVIRLEIYGINYNLPELTGPNAIAFKESFLEAKKQLASRGVVVKNLQIIFGNRQYIQDTATYWVKAMNLLD